MALLAESCVDVETTKPVAVDAETLGSQSLFWHILIQCLRNKTSFIESIAEPLVDL